jgi:hypothetical protein
VREGPALVRRTDPSCTVGEGKEIGIDMKKIRGQKLREFSSDGHHCLKK